MKFRESETMELKLAVTNDLKKEVTAFANSKGGTIYIGIDDEGEIVGLKSSPERLCEQIASMIRDGIKPDVSVFVEIKSEQIGEKEVIKIGVGRGTRRPYYLTEKGLKPSGVYVRLGNTSVPATETFIRNMIIETDGTSYEQMRSVDQDLTFFTAEAEFKKRGLPFEGPQMKTMGLLDHDGIYTNLALLLSDQCQHAIKAAVFRGANKDEFVTRKEFNGSLFKQAEEAYSFIDLANQLHATFEGLNRIDTRDYSEMAIREGLLNALIHRDYAFSGSTLISIFNDRMELVSLGGLAPGLELEDIFEGISQSRNPKLANVFYRLNYVEAYGTGIKKIQSECKKVGVRADFSATNAAFKTVLPNRNKVQAVVRVFESSGIETAVLKYMQDHHSISRKEIQEVFGLKQTKSGTLLKSLEIQGLIVKRGEGKNTVYQIASKQYLY